MVTIVEFHHSSMYCHFLAVQKERDRLGRQRGSNYHYRMMNIPSTTYHIDEGDDDDDLSVMALLRAEQTAQEVSEK